MIYSGIDLIDTQRIKKTLENNRDGFLKRVCTDSEQTFLKNHGRKEEKLAGIFALKEAFSKALGTGIGERLSFQDLEVTYLESGQPKIKYIGSGFSSVKNSWQISCSVSHEGSMLAAVVILLGEVK
jgi:holo-[acyl-carrier protein] synthase